MDSILAYYYGERKCESMKYCVWISVVYLLISESLSLGDLLALIFWGCSEHESICRCWYVPCSSRTGALPERRSGNGHQAGNEVCPLGSVEVARVQALIQSYLLPDWGGEGSSLKRQQDLYPSAGRPKTRWKKMQILRWKSTYFFKVKSFLCSKLWCGCTGERADCIQPRYRWASGCRTRAAWLSLLLCAASACHSLGVCWTTASEIAMEPPENK